MLLNGRSPDFGGTFMMRGGLAAPRAATVVYAPAQLNAVSVVGLNKSR